jgi:hypothetical protein
MKPRELVERSVALFNVRKAITTLWQEISEHFYPQRADFTLTRYIGEEFAEQLFSSYPLIVHRELSNAFAAMLRPRRKDWFGITVDNEDRLSKGAKEWLEWATKRMKFAMYDRHAHFIRATTEGDADFAAFGQCCLTREINWAAENPHLLYRCWHLRDVAWDEMADGSVGEIYIRWKPTLKQLKQQFGEDALHPTTRNKKDDYRSDTYMKPNYMRAAISTDVYEGQEGQGRGYPWILVYMDVLNNHIIHELGTFSHGITLPRWQTVSGSQYAYSPATVAGLPDARLLQAMTLTLLEAGEMSVRPPMVATQDAVRSDVQLYAGGITWADSEYDERKGDVLRPITQDRRGLPMGYEAHDQQMGMLASAFYLNKLTLPPPEGDMTAFEVGQRVEEYVRAALPLFEPMEHEYNGQLCEDTFDSLLRAGHFGAVQDIPRELQGRDVHFRFLSPLHDAIERKHASEFLESADLIERAMQLDPTSTAHMDIGSSLRAALEGVGLEQRHIRSEKEVEQMIAQAQAMAQAQQEAELAATAGDAAQKFSAAEQGGGAII